MSETYLGDGLYAKLLNGMIKLYTEQGMEVYLEPEVAKAFVEFAKKVGVL